jgi:predicted transposase YdaD
MCLLKVLSELLMTKNELAHPHDLLTRSILADPELAGSLLENYVEPETVTLLDLTQLRCESPVNVDKSLVEIIGDLRFSTVFKNTQQQSNVFVFLEHQSSRDNLMSFRALEEVVKAFRQYIDTVEQDGQPKSFPCPIVVIIYHGKRPWGTLKRMRDLIDSVPGFPKDLLDFPIFLIDLSLIPPEQLKGHPTLQALLEILQLGSEEKLEAGFDRVTSRLAAVRNDSRVTGWMTAFVRYAMSLCRIGQQAIYNAFSKILDEKEAQKMATSTMQELLLEGEAKGEAKGKVQGKRDAVLDCLTARFGNVPKAISDVVNSYNDLTALTSLVVLASTCKSLDEFKDGL